MNLSEESRLAILTSLLGGDGKKVNGSTFWKIGRTYLVRTVTMIYIGDLKEIINDQELVLEDCAWIPETSRWNEFLNGKKPNEMEPYPNDVLIGRGAILDVTEYKEKIKREVL